MKLSTTLLALLFILTTAPALRAQDSPVGMWQTKDDETGEVKSVIEIYAQDGKFFGKIAEILTDNKDATCTKCSGKQKNAPLLGLVIIEDLARNGDYWSGGTILDPQKGSEYGLSAWFEDDPNVIYIRGKHWTGLYRTQEWTRMP